MRRLRNNNDNESRKLSSQRNSQDQGDNQMPKDKIIAKIAELDKTIEKMKQDLTDAKNERWCLTEELKEQEITKP